MTTVAEQRDLKKTFLAGVEKNHPVGVPEFLFDLANEAAQAFKLTAETLGVYRIGEYLKQFKVLAPQATAGLRETFDILDWNNPNYMYNPVFTTMLIRAEADFIKELHTKKAAKLAGMDLSMKAAEMEKALPVETIQGIREMFGGRTVQQILELLRDKPMKVIGKEVRPQTDQMLELEARIMAAEDITIITMEDFTDTTNIYLNSFLCFLLGSDGGTYYTPSHSSVYVLGRKALAADGAQLLPEVYNRFIEILAGIYDKAMVGGYEVSLSAKSDPNILYTLTYQRVAELFSRVLAPTREAIEQINETAKRGLRIVLNTLSGSAAKSLAAQFVALGINQKIFTPLWAEEDSFFNAGYAVIQKDGTFLVDHLGVDTSAPMVVRQIPYADVLTDAEIGTQIYECDPDNDRFVVKQVLSEDARALCETFGIDVYELGNGKILVAPSPNKTFLLLDIADYERMKANGQWEQYEFLYFPTYVSSAAWQEFSAYVAKEEGNLETFLCRVGFKNFNGALAEIQNWWFNRPDEAALTIQPQLGEPITLDRSRILRVLSKEEESGGRTAGLAEPLMNILGQQIFSLPEKATGDALMAHLTDMARRFLAGEEMDLPSVVQAAYDKYDLKSRIDYRLDILHGDQGIIAQVGPEEAAQLKASAGAEKANFNTFFFSVAKAIRNETLTLDQARVILMTVLPAWNETWQCLDLIMYVEEELMPGQFRPEGVVMTFSAKDDLTPMVTQFKFRPSGTDPLKSKVYIDAEVLGSGEIEAINVVLNVFKKNDLFKVLDRFGIAYSEPRPATVDQIQLRSMNFISPSPDFGEEGFRE
ncbi:hypothetical protein COT42_01190 [Candidatus Saganbacteria bacterium CG08_land_8_20_14_0_20_45_16]|uniref:Uncharacterized protein n=1 Tax=Candidatus Saganbacteria bacterium CG08_land_8_20_14_0_20_45_16 TaxID=2014293 RepID=A0A2H0Y1F5_UNCSA|nr:MAG: hypothetical protein COT42_01190 [Candidatus Saganbacteria bacterium CG08_land_8_20_14_0_20_45_16]